MPFHKEQIDFEKKKKKHNEEFLSLVTMKSLNSWKVQNSVLSKRHLQVKFLSSLVSLKKVEKQ